MGVNTAAYLITPKVVAALFVIPILVIYSAFVAILGGYLASVPTGLITYDEYYQGLMSFFAPYNVFMMLVKAFVFAFILTTVSCYQGYYVTGAAASSWARPAPAQWYSAQHPDFAGRLSDCRAIDGMNLGELRFLNCDFRFVCLWLNRATH